MKKALTLLAITQALLLTHTTLAQDATWTGNTSTDWNTGTNWTPTSTPSGEAIFGLSGTEAVTVGTATDIERMRFNNNGTWNFSGSTISITGADVGSGSSRPLGIHGAVNVTFDNLITFDTSADPGKGTIDIQSGAGGSSITFNSGIQGNPATSDFAIRTVGRIVSGSAAEFVIKNSISDVDTIGWYTGNSILDIQASSSVSQSTNIEASGDVTLKLGNDNALGTGSLIIRQASTSLAILQASGSDRSFSNNVTLNSGQGNSDIGNYAVTGDHDLSFTGTTTLSRHVVMDVASTRRLTLSNVSGVGRDLTKQGEGTLALGDANLANVSVNEGILIVNGTMALQNTPTFTVTDTGTLGGSGDIIRSISFTTGTSGGGILSPGDPNVNSGIGTLTIGNVSNPRTLIFASDTVLDFQFQSTAEFDQLALYGDLTLDGLLNVSSIGLTGPENFMIISYTGSLTNNGLVINSLPTGWEASLDTSTNGQVWLNVTAIPESNSIYLAIGTLLVTLFIYRKKQINLRANHGI